MCISQSVGAHGGKNHHDDVKTVQVLLNLNLAKLFPLAPLVEDGAIARKGGKISAESSKTVAAIEEFQRRVMGKETPDGRVDPHGGTLKQLHDGMPGGFVGGKLQGIMIHADPAVINKFFPLLLAAMPRFQITTPLRMAHFLSQLGHESGEFRFTEEIASGTQYEGRRDLGNTQKGDGVRFKGRGLIQLTGRTNYTAFGVFKGTDFTTDASAKTLATDPSLAVEVSGFFWKTRNLNPLADADNVVRVTEVVNGGHRGLADRKAKLARAKFFLIP